MKTTTTDKMWNLTADQWSSVLQSQADSAAVAARLRRSGGFVPWSQVLVEETADCESTADLGCGRGEHSAVLARAGRQTTLVDWSPQNLAFCSHLYDELGLRGRFCQADITRPLPLASNSVDMVFSCGVFEYFNAAQIDAIMAEAFRVARKRVIIMVPNARAIAYRLGKWYMEHAGTWEWGGEVPSHTLKPHFRRAGASTVREFTVGGQHSVDFLAPLPGGSRAVSLLTRALRLTRHPRPSRLRQGYLLVTVGQKLSNGARQ
jgi:SAM-dependent methyltransferase